MRSAASWLAQMRYGVVPQMLPGFLSYGLLRFEINVRSSTIIGFVGAGRHRAGTEAGDRLQYL